VCGAQSAEDDRAVAVEEDPTLDMSLYDVGNGELDDRQGLREALGVEYDRVRGLASVRPPHQQHRLHGRGGLVQQRGAGRLSAIPLRNRIQRYGWLVSITVRELLDMPHLQLRLHSGKAGLDRQVTWTHTSDLPEPWQWVSAGELLMTNGMSFPAAAASRSICSTSCSGWVPAGWPSARRCTARG
jgi:Purine catabolism regulatory protein-like family